MKKTFSVLLGGLMVCFVTSPCLFAQEQSVQEFPVNITGDALYEQGFSFLGQEKYQEAIPYFEEAVKRKSNFCEAYYQLGLCYLKTKQFAKAKQSLSFAKVLSPDKNLKEQASNLIAKIPEEIEKEKKEKEGVEKKEINEEWKKTEEAKREEQKLKEGFYDIPWGTSRKEAHQKFPGENISGGSGGGWNTEEFFGKTIKTTEANIEVICYCSKNWGLTSGKITYKFFLSQAEIAEEIQKNPDLARRFLPKGADVTTLPIEYYPLIKNSMKETDVNAILIKKMYSKFEELENSLINKYGQVTEYQRNDKPPSQRYTEIKTNLVYCGFGEFFENVDFWITKESIVWLYSSKYNDSLGLGVTYIYKPYYEIMDQARKEKEKKESEMKKKRSEEAKKNIEIKRQKQEQEIKEGVMKEKELMEKIKN